MRGELVGARRETWERSSERAWRSGDQLRLALLIVGAARVRSVAGLVALGGLSLGQTVELSKESQED